MPDLVERIAKLTPEQRALLEKLTRKSTNPDIILPANRHQQELWSYSQRRVWFLSQLEPESPFYNITGAFQLTGELNISVLQMSLADVVRRHEALRTGFRTERGEPIVVIHSEPEISLNVEQIGSANEKLADEILQQRIRQEAAKPFHLANDRLVRATLLQAPHRTILLITMHHIVSDGWSINIFVHELSQVYSDRIAGRDPSLPELNVQFADYAIWERSRLKGEFLEGHLTYWREKLRELTPLELPLDHERPRKQIFLGRTCCRKLRAELVVELKRLSREEGVTLYMTLLAGFQLLLSRYSGQQDIVVGSPVANRTRREIEGVIGFFVNTLVLRTRVKGEESLRRLLAEVKETTLGAFAHQDVPFEKLVEVLQPERDLSRNPLFQVMFVVQNMPRPHLNLPGLKVEGLPVETGTSKFDMSFFLEEQGDELDCTLEYNTGLWEGETIERLLGHWEKLLWSAVSEPEKAVGELEMLPEEERRQIVYEWNRTERAYAKDKCIHHLIEEQTRRTPDAIAVVYEGQHLSYAELNRRANQLARFLVEQGAGPEKVVAICMDRSLELPLVLLAILKSGAAYLPLDASHPRERLEFVLREAIPALLLWRGAEVSPSLRNDHGALAFDSINCHSQSAEDLTSSAAPENAAYVIYTSGSTGSPKGVVVSHRNLTNAITALCQILSLKQEDCLMATTALNFDVAALELYAMLLLGGRVVVGLLLRESLIDISQRLEAELATVMQATPTVWDSLLGWTWDKRLDIKTLCGGETMLSRTGQKLSQIGSAVWNLYGPSETTIWSSAHPACDFSRHTVAIGRPIANTRIYLLQENLEPVPIGGRGELFIAGDGVTRGYLASPALTAARFLPDPFTGHGERMYRTGDLGRFEADGTIEFLGRRDQQVKVRGQRIELAEIEGALMRCPEVQNCSVIAENEQSGMVTLVAYLVLRPTHRKANAGQQDSRPLNRAHWREELRERIPEYMIPSGFVVLDELPLTSSGKVDRKALPAPEVMAGEGDYVGPRTGVEEMVVEVWKEVLGARRIGIRDNFFLLGGHSLLATQVMSRLREVFEVEMPLREIFEHPTVEETAGWIEGGWAGEGRRPMPRLERAARRETMPLSYAQQRLWFMDQLVPENPFYNMAAGFRLKGDLDEEAFRGSVQGLVERHESLRTSFEVQDGEPVQRIAEQMRLTVNEVDLRGESEAGRWERVAGVVEEEVRKPFDLRRAPLVRVKLIRTGEEERIVVVTMHHIISDGWSMGVLVREMAGIYEAESKAERAKLPELAIQYADYAVWQRGWLKGERLEEQIGYWREQLKELPVLELPSDKARKGIQSFRGGLRKKQLRRELVEALRELSREEGVTLYMTLLAGFQLLLSRYSGQEDIVVGSPVANRTRREIEGVIGFFVNTLVLRTRVKGEESLRRLLAEVKETTLGAFAHQDVPFEKLVEVLQPERDLSRNPLFQVMFVVQNMPRPHLNLPGLKVESVDVQPEIAKFDLQMFVSDEDLTFDCTLEYNTGLWEGETIERLLGHWEKLLWSAVSEPEKAVGELEMLPEEERRQIVYEWNRTERAYAKDKCIHHLIEEQTRRTPDAIAVVYEGQHLSYAELNRRANQLARFLVKQGAGPEKVVAICMDRSLELPLVLLAILKSGAAYLPLEVHSPQRRFHNVLASSKAIAMLTPAGLPTYDGTVRVISLQSIWKETDFFSADDLAVFSAPESLAYVIYTSGSTGIPKGAANHHAGLSNRLRWMQQALQLECDDAVLQKTPYTFDVSVWEFFLPLMSGARLVMAKPDGHRDPSYLRTTMLLERVTTAHFVPSMLRVFMQDCRGKERLALKSVICSGERLTPELLRDAINTMDGSFWNLYGPTEAAIDVTAWHREPEWSGTLVPIGTPISNIATRVLSRQGQLVPVGVPGELYLAGVGVCRGYIADPALTAEKFLPDPFSNHAGARIYKTGDAVRYTAQGELDYLGRLDDQIKLRGYRIEVGEIEAALKESASVESCVVVLREDRPGDARLVGYVVPSKKILETPAEMDHQSARVVDWNRLWDEVYRSTEAPDPAFNTEGWKSSYTGERIPATEMREWLENTLQQLSSLSPESVLEIGCGTGMLIFGLAPRCRNYVATDFSAEALSYVGRHLPKHWAVQLIQAPAHFMDQLPADARPDLAILNSVVQYFPSIDYLVGVLGSVIDRVRPGGAVFIGDLRHLGLLEAFSVSVELAHASDDVRIAQLRQKIRQRVEHEEELLVAPELFYALSKQLPRVTQVEIRAKQGCAENELTRFRYDVILRIEGAPSTIAVERVAQWPGNGRSLKELNLSPDMGNCCVIERVPNARVIEHVHAAKLLQSADTKETVADFKARLAENDLVGIKPDEVCRLGSALGYETILSWGAGHNDGSYDVLLKKMNSSNVAGSEMWWPAGYPSSKDNSVAPENLKQYANVPLRKKLGSYYFAHWREELRERIPEYMIPSGFVVLDELPLTSSGKVDRKALPAPEVMAGEGDYVGPRTGVEEMVVEVWKEVLGARRIGIRDNFFLLGGHSLLATQVMSRLREVFEVEMPLREIFEHPTVEETAGWIEGGWAGEGRRPMPRLERAARRETMPLSYAQQRLWFMDQLVPENPFYNMAAGFRLKGDLDEEAFRGSVQGLVERHESLRTSFEVQDGEPVQRIAEQMRLTVNEVDLRGESEAGRWERVAGVVEEEVRKPFDLRRAPLVRVKLIRTGEEERIVVVTMHHIISDGWSMGVLVREMAGIYEAESKAERAKLPELAIQYADYAVWQRGWLKGERLEEQIGYWREQLKELPVLELPSDKARKGIQSFRGGLRKKQLRRELVEALRELSREEGVTLYMTLLAGFQLLLSRYSGQEDIVVGSPVANRTRREIEGVIGFFVNTLVLRTRVKGEESLRRLLAEVKETTLGAFAHQDVPFEKLVEVLQPERDLSRNPLFQVMFVVQNMPRPHLNLPGLKVEGLPVETGTSKFDMSFFLEEQGDELDCTLEYNTGLWEGETIERLLGHWEKLLWSAVSEPEKAVGELEMLPEEERRQIVYEWNRTERAYAKDKCIHHLIEEQTRRTPDAIAAISENNQLTYAELDRRAERLATYLRSFDIGPGHFVAVLMRRSTDLVISFLAVLKCGAIFVPLDITYPKARIQQVLDTLKINQILSEGGVLEAFGRPFRDHFTTCVCIDDPLVQKHLSGQLPPPSAGPDAPVDPDYLAYVIFTSGSTGVPKGVVIRHRSVVNAIDWANRTYAVGPKDRVLWLSSVCFDLTIYDIFGFLASGGSIRIVPDDRRYDPEYLAQALVKDLITFWDSAPAGLQQVMPIAESLQVQDGSDDLRLVFLSGDWVPITLPDALKSRFPKAQLVVLGGATESTVWSNHFPVEAVHADWVSIPYGRPIQNAEYFILDEFLNPCPPGVPGDLFIGGDCLLVGYGNDPQLSAWKLIPHPFALRPGARIYRTGDRARYFADGNIEFLGRLDNQYKLRGYRIEAGEVETVLATFPGVSQAAVMVREDTPGNRRLVAYLVADHKVKLQVGNLRDHLQARLPEYMVPTALVFVPSIPLSSNGKVDRRALPAPESERLRESKVLPPRTTAERKIAEIWSEILHVPEVGVFDNFFSLGGHSLSATKMFAKVKETFNIKLPLRDALQAANLADLAELVENAILLDLAALTEAEIEQRVNGTSI